MEVAKARQVKPWFDDGWTDADLEKLEEIVNETEDINRRVTLRNKKLAELNKKVQRQRENGCLAV